MEAEAQGERERVEQFQETLRKRERRLLHKGKLRKVDDERKKSFDIEFPVLTEIARRWDDSRHYLEFTQEEQTVIKQEEADEREATAQGELQHRRLSELEAQYAKSLAEETKRAQLVPAPSPSAKKIERKRSHFRYFFPSLLFTDSVLKKLCSLDESECDVFYHQFQLMGEGKTDGKHVVPLTEPKIWVLDAGNSGKVYYRRDSANRYVVELVGFKHHQNADYAWLRKQFPC